MPEHKDRRRAQPGTAICLVALSVAALTAYTAAGADQTPPDPFAFFRPTILVTDRERQRLNRGESIVRVLPGDDREVAVFAAVPLAVDGERLMTWVRHIDQMKKSKLVLAIARFSDQPVIDDLKDLALNDADVNELRTCRPGKCGVKLSTAEITRLQQEAARPGPDLTGRVRQAFRQVVLDRVRAYLARGHASLADYDDGHSTKSPQATLASILGRSGYLKQKLPRFVEHLEGFPKTAMPGVETFMYWSTEQFGGKPVTSVTHVSILQGDGVTTPRTLVAGKQVFATHYFNGSVNITAALQAQPGGRYYLVTFNRSEVDVLGGFFGGLARLLIERRVKSEASEVLQGLRRRIESGLPR